MRCFFPLNSSILVTVVATAVTIYLLSVYCLLDTVLRNLHAHLKWVILFYSSHFTDEEIDSQRKYINQRPHT